MRIDPAWAFGWGVVTTVTAFLAATGLPAFVDPHVNDVVKQSAVWFAGFSGAIATYCSGYVSDKVGPLVKKPDGQ